MMTQNSLTNQSCNTINEDNNEANPLKRTQRRASRKSKKYTSIFTTLEQLGESEGWTREFVKSLKQEEKDEILYRRFLLDISSIEPAANQYFGRICWRTITGNSFTESVPTTSRESGMSPNSVRKARKLLQQYQVIETEEIDYQPTSVKVKRISDWLNPKALQILKESKPRKRRELTSTQNSTSGSTDVHSFNNCRGETDNEVIRVSATPLQNLKPNEDCCLLELIEFNNPEQENLIKTTTTLSNSVPPQNLKESESSRFRYVGAENTSDGRAREWNADWLSEEVGLMVEEAHLITGRSRRYLVEQAIKISQAPQLMLELVSVVSNKFVSFYSCSEEELKELLGVPKPLPTPQESANALEKKLSLTPTDASPIPAPVKRTAMAGIGGILPTLQERPLATPLTPVAVAKQVFASEEEEERLKLEITRSLRERFSPAKPGKEEQINAIKGWSAQTFDTAVEVLLEYSKKTAISDVCAFLVNAVEKKWTPSSQKQQQTPQPAQPRNPFELDPADKPWFEQAVNEKFILPTTAQYCGEVACQVILKKPVAGRISDPHPVFMAKMMHEILKAMEADKQTQYFTFASIRALIGYNYDADIIKDACTKLNLAGYCNCQTTMQEDNTTGYEFYLC